MVSKATTEEKKLDKKLSEVEEFIRNNKRPKPNIAIQIIQMTGKVKEARDTVNALQSNLQSMKPDHKTQQMKSRLTQYNVTCNKYEKQLEEIQARSVLAGSDSDEDNLGNFEGSDDESSTLVDKTSSAVDNALRLGYATQKSA